MLGCSSDDIRRETYPNKKIKSEAHYVDNLKHGTEKEFYESGAIKAITPYEKGLREGDVETFFENGKLQSKTPYRKGKIEGMVTLYYENGQLKSKIIYREGIPVSFPELFDPDGEWATSGSFKDSRDNYPYEWVRINNQIWTAQNINFAPLKGAVCAQCNVWGRLYDLESAKTACPEFFRMPLKEDWNTLLQNTAPESGKNLKAGFGWDPVKSINDYGNGTDAFGFSIRASGGHFASADVPAEKRIFKNAGKNAYFWVEDGRVLVFSYNKNTAEFQKFNPKHGASLRCVKTIQKD